MRAQAQGLSSAANSDGSASRGSVFGRRSAATRASSRSSDGSGAPSHSGRLTVLALAIAALALLAFAPLSQAKVVVDGYGTTGTLGGQFGTPRGIDVNRSANGGVPAGTTYVVDSQNRVQRFSPGGAFERAWGENVSGRDEQQLLTIDPNAVAGTFTLTFDGHTTPDINYLKDPGTSPQPSSTTLRNALAALPSIGSGNVTVSGGVHSVEGAFVTIRFTGALGGTDVPQLSIDTSQLTGVPPITASVETLETGSGGPFAGFEICTDAAKCKEGSAASNTANGGQLNNPQGVAVNQANGHVYVTEQTNRRVSEFDADGSFVRAWGWDVVSTGGTGNVSTSAFEICTVAADCKQAASNGADGGRFAAQIGYPTVDSSNNVWIPDAANRRIQEFDSAGNFIAAYGWGVVPAGRAGNVPGNEEQRVTLNANALGGTYRLRFGGTAAANTSASINLGASAATVQGILEGVSRIGVGNVAVTGPDGGPYDVTFVGALADIDHPQMTSDASALTGPQTITVSGTGGTFTLTFDGRTTDPIGFDAPASAVQSELELLSTIGAGNVTVTSPNPNGGPYTVSFTGALAGAQPPVTANGSGLTPSGSISVDVPDAIVATTKPGNALEACTSTAVAACQAGTSGSNPGQFGNNNPKDVAFDSGGNLYALDSTNNRVQKFDPTLLASVSDFATGTLAAYTAAAPDRIAATHGGSRLALAVNNTVTASPAERQIVEIDPSDDSVKDVSLVGVGLTGSSAVLGMAEGSTTSSLYMTSAALQSPRNVLELGDAPPDDPVVTLDPVATKTDTTATLTGSVDLTAGIVSCKFEYSTDPTFAAVATAQENDCASFAGGGGPQAVSESIAGLAPGTQYFARLVVSLFGSSSTVVSTAETFTTDAVAPVVSDLGAIEVNDTSARLVGTIDGKNSATGYVFRYGTTPSLGSSTSPVDIGNNPTPQTVSQVIEGLQPSTTYYFKLVATNLVGEAASGTKTFITRATPFSPPDGRAYEQVTPVDKTYGDAHIGNGSAAPNGDGAAICALTGFGDPPGQVGLFCASYVSSRTPGSWQTHAINAPYCANDVTQTSIQLGIGVEGAVSFLSADYERAFVTQPEAAGCPIPPLDPTAPLPAANVYRADYGPSGADYSLLLSAPAFGTSKFNTPTGRFAGASKDLDTIVMHSSGDQTPDAPPPGNFKKIYSWHDDGSVSLVSKDTNDVPFTTDTDVPGRDGSNPGAVSASGNRIFFYNPASGQNCDSASCDIYMRENDTTTYNVSESECTSACGASAEDVFRLATPDGRKVFFTSTGKLTDDDTSSNPNPDLSNPNPDLFMYTHSADPANEQNLTLLSADNEPSDGNTADVQGVVGASDDGNTVYFVASGQLVAGASTGLGPKLYRWMWNDGVPTLSYLATLSAETPAPGGGSPDLDNWIPSQGDSPRNRAVTPDGSYVMIDTLVSILPAVDRDSDRDVYRWSAEEGWRCASCQAPGAPSAGDSTVPHVLAPSSTELQIFMSDDGRIVFTTADALVAEDTNGSGGCPPYGNDQTPSCQDVYEWNGGLARLVSSGLGEQPVELVGMSSSGRDVFFFTRERLVGWDTDSNVDMYDARIGGGFPEPPVEGAPCEGDACRGAGSNAPNITGAGSRAFVGQGNRRDNGNTCNRFSKKAQHKLRVAKTAAKRGQAKRARKLRKQARNQKRRAKRCNRRQGR